MVSNRRFKVKVEDSITMVLNLVYLICHFNCAFKPICISYWEFLMGTTVRLKRRIIHLHFNGTLHIFSLSFQQE